MIAFETCFAGFTCITANCRMMPTALVSRRLKMKLRILLFMSKSLGFMFLLVVDTCHKATTGVVTGRCVSECARARVCESVPGLF